MRTLFLGLAIIGLQSGCGESEADLEPQADLASNEAALYTCLTDSLTVYYNDATYTTEVGSDRCFCRQTPLRTGIRSPYFIEYVNSECL
ncbi:hypothetical protein LY474_32815 [Myxococcus stipitatus]|uniref:hypothetical protein n=1 Tax=Myxococcus stipitatus TaxID=83455 RepID=UPI001F319EA8|nr:hypothetical protein [Myxococcus stipitatus]MCE9672602.1 hypothetical protein [Myxococcus stipitatus]